jgi:pyruvate/2-oxoglutarate dehydrogenase complex dihydrolipoamide acyltransferase (E2) component
MITIGTMRKEMRKMEDGSMQERTLLDATFTIDERIADGFYFAKSLRITRYLLEHPEHLLETMETPVPVSLS